MHLIAYLNWGGLKAQKPQFGIPPPYDLQVALQELRACVHEAWLLALSPEQ